MFKYFKYNHQETDFVSLKREAGKVCFLSQRYTNRHQQSKETELVFNFLSSVNKFFYFLILPQLKPPWHSEVEIKSGSELDWHLPELEAQRDSLFHASVFNPSVPTTAATKPGIATVI